METGFPKTAYPALGLIAVFAGVGFWADGPLFAVFLVFPVAFGLAGWALMRRRGKRQAVSTGIWTAAATLTGTAARQIGLWVPAALVAVALLLMARLERRA